MNKKTIGLFLLATGLCLTISAQVTGRFTGPGNRGLPLVSVTLLQLPDSATVTTRMADSSGRFTVPFDRGHLFVLWATATGFQPWYSAPWQSDSAAVRQLGEIELSPSPSSLAAVQVRAVRPPFEQQSGGLVLNPSASIMTKGSTLLALLQRSPGVSLDPQTSGLSLNGKSGVTVALNGKTLRLPMEEVVRLLNDMSADEVDKIELLNTPSSKYDAQGSAGLINIVMKKNRQRGTNGSGSLSGGYGKGEKLRAMISLSHNARKWGLNGSYSFSHDRGYDFLDGVSDQVFPPLGGAVNVRFTNRNNYRDDAHNASLGFDFRPDSTISLSGNMLFTAGAGNSGTINRRVITYHADSALNFFSDIGSRSHRNNLVNSLSLEKKWNSKSRAVFGVDRILYNSDAPTTASSDFRTPEGAQAGHNDTLFSPLHRGFAQTSIRVSVISVDYSHRFSNSLLMETGLKGTHTGSDSRSGIESLVNGEWVSREETSNHILLNENIGAAYVSLTADLDKKTNVALGLRYEYSRTRMHDPGSGTNRIDRRLGAIFPNLALTRKLNDRETFRFSYSKRVTRPSYNDLSSFVTYNDPFSVFSGNPFLKPTITHNLKLGYSHGQLSFSLLASRDLHAIAEYQIVASPEQDLMIIAPQNTDWHNSLLLQATLPAKINRWLSISNSVIGGWHRFHETYTEFPLSKTWFGLSANSSLTAEFSQGWAAELSGFYTSRSYNGTILTRDYWSLNTGLKKTLPRDRGTLQLSITDVFQGLRYRVAYGTLTKEAFSGSSRLTVYSESAYFPVIRFTYSRSFGRSLSGNKEDSGRSAEERNRIK